MLFLCLFITFIDVPVYIYIPIWCDINIYMWSMEYYKKLSWGSTFWYKKKTFIFFIAILLLLRLQWDRMVLLFVLEKVILDLFSNSQNSKTNIKNLLWMTEPQLPKSGFSEGCLIFIDDKFMMLLVTYLYNQFNLYLSIEISKKFIMYEPVFQKKQLYF